MHLVIVALHVIQSKRATPTSTVISALLHYCVGLTSAAARGVHTLRVELTHDHSANGYVALGGGGRYYGRGVGNDTFLEWLVQGIRSNLPRFPYPSLHHTCTANKLTVSDLGIPGLARTSIGQHCTYTE
ncbi:hypothetical protein J6590_018887 [Homalodisca vitripennis]|nr:hypothetical protein J6590_018887 [Homalodisca vitripennis]